MTIGKRIKKLRKYFGLTQSELAFECGVSERTVRGIESEDYETTLSTIQSIMSYFGYNVEMKRKRLILEETCHV